MLLRALIVALFAVVASVTGALAHAGLISAEPADGAVLGGPPAAMVLTFTEPVSPIAFSIVGLDEAPAPLRPDRQDGPILHVPLPPQLAAGSYLFSWRVTSEDGHPVNGTVSFAVGAPSGTIAAAASDPSLVAGIWLVRVLQYAALFFGVGSAAFGALAPLPAGVRRVSRGASASGLLLSVPAIGLQGIDLLGLPLGALFSAAPWSEALASPYAQTQALFAIAFVLALLPRRLPVIAAGLAGALAPTLSGHASTAAPQLLMRGAVFVHLASLMVWLGALLPLFASLDKIDSRLIEAGNDLYANSFVAFWKVTWPLSLPGVVSGTLLTFIPAAGDYINAQLLGSPNQRMVGNVIQDLFTSANDYPAAGALSMILMIIIVVMVLFYVRRAGTEDLL